MVQTELSRFLFNPTSVPIWQRPLLQVAKLFTKTPAQVQSWLHTESPVICCVLLHVSSCQHTLFPWHLFRDKNDRALAGVLQGAETSIWLAQAPVVEHVTSKYFVNCKPVTTSKESYDTDVARRLWELSAQFTGTDGHITGTTSGAKESVETMTSST